jgi:hypothetical protein
MIAPDLALLHLVRHGNDPALFAAFRDAYRRHDAGIAHRLVILLKGFPQAHGFDAGLPAELLVLPDDGQDLLAYRRAAASLDAGVICCTNSYARPDAAAWLAHLARALEAHGVGIAGASGSWESARDATRQALAQRAWHQRLPRQALVDLCFPAFPNPAIRTNAFIIRPQDYLRLVPGWIGGKFLHAAVESGRLSLTRRLLRAGRRAVVVDRHGAIFDVPEWPRSATWRAGGQAGLMVRDNRSDGWDRAAPAERARLSRLAWGQEAGGDQAEDFSSTETTSSPEDSTASGRSGSA